MCRCCAPRTLALDRALSCAHLSLWGAGGEVRVGAGLGPLQHVRAVRALQGMQALVSVPRLHSTPRTATRTDASPPPLSDRARATLAHRPPSCSLTQRTHLSLPACHIECCQPAHENRNSQPRIATHTPLAQIFRSNAHHEPLRSPHSRALSNAACAGQLYVCAAGATATATLGRPSALGRRPIAGAARTA